MKQLKTASDVIDALGGTVAVRKLSGRSSNGVISNWRTANKLQPDTFLIFTAELEKRGYRANPLLWGIKPVS